MRNINTERCACGGCGWAGEVSDLGTTLEDTPDLGIRLDPGGEAPVGECPECGALAYLTHNPKAIVLIGSVVDGLTIAGPFDSIGEACNWAEREVTEHNWNAALLTTTTQYEES